MRGTYFLEASFGATGVHSARWFMLTCGKKFLLDERKGADSHKLLLEEMVQESRIRGVYRDYGDLSTAVSSNVYTWRTKPFQLEAYEHETYEKTEPASAVSAPPVPESHDPFMGLTMHEGFSRRKPKR